jgi:peptide-methionine (S)-S-oxide reductase
MHPVRELERCKGCMESKTATFAAGCFWGVEDAFAQLPGVIDAVSGYTGGHVDNPTYRQVCGHATGHAEAVEVTYDPQRISYDQLLDFFWQIHDPTQLNRQGPDVGDQYRSAIFTHDDEQARAAAASRDREQSKHARPIVTEIAPASRFWRAEEYHQRYFEKNGGASCHIIPKVTR